MKPDHSFIKYALAAGLLFPLTASATIGYFAHGYGTKNKGMAGAGVATAQDSLAAATNPASMVFVGERMDVGAAIFSPRRNYTAGPPTGGPGTFPLTPERVRSDSDYFLVPHFGYNWMLNKDSSAGISVYGNGGMNTDYPGTPNGGCGTYASGCLVPGSDAKTGVNLAQLFINLSYARKYKENTSYGISAIFAYQQFEATGLASFGGFVADGNPNNLTDNGVDSASGAGIKVGWQSRIGKGADLGISYQSKISMSEFDKYADLFAEQGDFDIPATLTLGFAYEPEAGSKVAFDIQRIYYSQVKSIANSLMPNLITNGLGSDGGAGFGWEDIIVFKLGYEFTGSPGWVWRAGISINENPIPNQEVMFNIIAPAVMKQHITMGFTKDMGNNQELNFAAMWAPTNTLTGPTQMDPTQQVTLEMRQFEIEASWGWKF